MSLNVLPPDLSYWCHPPSLSLFPQPKPKPSLLSWRWITVLKPNKHPVNIPKIWCEELLKVKSVNKLNWTQELIGETDYLQRHTSQVPYMWQSVCGSPNHLCHHAGWASFHKFGCCIVCRMVATGGDVAQSVLVHSLWREHSAWQECWLQDALFSY